MVQSVSNIAEKRHPFMKNMDRREFLRLGGAAAAAGAGYYAGNKLESLRRELRATPESQRTGEGYERQKKMADLASAGVVVGQFLHAVVWNGAIKETVTGTAGEVLGPKSAAKMMALEGARVALLSSLGGDYAKRGYEELHELVDGLKLVPILVGLSDASTRALHVDPDKLLGRDQFVSRLPSRPPLEQPQINHWEAHHIRLEELLTQSVADLIAVTSALAPLGTTYASSVTADRMKEGVLKTLHELTFSRQVVGVLRQDDRRYLDKEKLEERAAKETNELFNGPWGFSKLALTLTSNVQGSWGIGDPPEIFAAMRHAKTPERLIKAHAFGIVNSEIHSLEGAMLWLKKAGVELRGAHLQTFIRQQGAVLSSLTQMVTRATRSEDSTSPVSIHGAEYLRIKREAAKSALEGLSEKTVKARAGVGKVLMEIQEDPKQWVKTFLNGRASIDSLIEDAAMGSDATLPFELAGIRGDFHDPRKRAESLPTEARSAVEEAIRQVAAAAAEPSSSGARNNQESTQTPAEKHDEEFLSHGAKEVLWALLTQVPVVAPAARLASEAVPKICGIEVGKRPSALQAKKAVGAYLLSVIAMSGFADNAAAYLFGEESLGDFFKTYYGERVFEEHPQLADLVTIVPLKLAEQAGSLTKVGNGPNFAQRKWEVVIRDGSTRVETTDMTLPETLQNRFAHLANIQLFLASIAAFSKVIDDLHKEPSA